MSKALFIVRPSREDLIEKLNTAVGIEIGSDVVEILDTHADPFGLYQIEDTAGRKHLTTRDDIVRTEIRQLFYDGKPITATQALTIEHVLTPYKLLWEDDVWNVEMALQLHLHKAITNA